VLPSYCPNCGKPYSWTLEAIAAARDYADELELSDEDKTSLKNTFADLTADTARTPLAATRFKKLIEKVGPAVGDGLIKIIVTIATEAAKKGIGL